MKNKILNFVSFFFCTTSGSADTHCTRNDSENLNSKILLTQSWTPIFQTEFCPHLYCSAEFKGVIV